MLVLRGLRAFSLSPNRDSARISCGPLGAFVGDVALLERMQSADETGAWTARPVAELNSELTARYRLPIDVSSKTCALALIANALNRGDLGMAAITTVQMQFPDPPALAKGVEADDAIMRRARELHRSRLLKAYWDPAKHPRAGMPPNPGWFAPAEHGSQALLQPTSGSPPLPISGADTIQVPTQLASGIVEVPPPVYKTIQDIFSSAPLARSALKTDLFHSIANDLRMTSIENGTYFIIESEGFPGISILLQYAVAPAGQAPGIVEYVYSMRDLAITHQTYIPNVPVTGKINNWKNMYPPFSAGPRT
jgi:hypothetical protein